MKPVVAYLRVSTDDKGQDPDRQRAPIEKCATEQGLQIVAWVVDEGTSAGENAIPTFERPMVREAIKTARDIGAKAIMVENVDRWTRKGPEDLGYSMYILKRTHGLDLIFADVPNDPFVKALVPWMQAFLAYFDNRRRSDMAKSSIAKRRAEGATNLGRIPKPPLTEDEYQRAIDMLRRPGVGLRTVAVALSRGRGAHLVPDTGTDEDRKERNQRIVSASWLADALGGRPETVRLLGRQIKSCHTPMSVIIQDVTGTPMKHPHRKQRSDKSGPPNVPQFQVHDDHRELGAIRATPPRNLIPSRRVVPEIHGPQKATMNAPQHISAPRPSSPPKRWEAATHPPQATRQPSG